MLVAYGISCVLVGLKLSHIAMSGPPAMFEDEIVIEEVYVPPQYEELAVNSEGDGLKLVLKYYHLYHRKWDYSVYQLHSPKHAAHVLAYSSI